MLEEPVFICSSDISSPEVRSNEAAGFRHLEDLTEQQV